MRRNSDAGPEQALLSAALLGQTGTAEGEPPTDRELREWVLGQLEGQRLEEVESHIAVNPATFERAMQHRRATHEVAPTRDTAGSTSWFRRGTFAPLAAGLAIVGMAGMATLVLLDGDSDPMQPGGSAPVLRSASTPHPDWRVAAFRAGYVAEREGVDARTHGASVDSGDCLDGDSCASLAALLSEFGATVARIDEDCASGGPDAETRVAIAATTRQYAASVAGSLELAAWRPHLEQLEQALQSGAAQTCAQSTALHAEFLTD